jgi:hypothetical protein
MCFGAVTLGHWRGLDLIVVSVELLRCWLWRPTQVCTSFGPSVQMGTIVSTHDFRVERAFRRSFAVVRWDRARVCHSDGEPSSSRASQSSGGRDRDSGGSGPTRTRGRRQHPNTLEKIDEHSLTLSLLMHLLFRIYLCYLDE